MELTEKTPKQPKPNATVADLVVGDRFVYCETDRAFDLSTGRSHPVLFRREGIVIEVKPADAGYYEQQRIDPSVAPRLRVDFKAPGQVARELAAGEPERFGRQMLCLELDCRITIYR